MVDEPRRSSRPAIRPAFAWFGLLAMGLATVIGSALAYDAGLPRVVTDLPFFDKVVHFGVFGSLAFFLDILLRQRTLTRALPVPLTAILVLVPAGIEEYLQRYSSNRDSNLLDFAADVGGVAVAILVARRLVPPSQTCAVGSKDPGLPS